VKRIEGVAVGLVSEVDAKLGRVKVKFPWMDPPQASYWAPIASLLAGKKRGARFMPELEDEALVAFDRGEFDHPYIVGFLWNGEDEAPDDVKTNRLIVTPGGHELRFEDKDGDRRIKIKTADGHSLTFDDKAKSITLESKKGHQLEVLDQDGKVTLKTKSGGKVTLDDQPGKAVVEASQNTITIGPDGIAINVTAGNLTVKSTAQTSIETQGQTTIKSTGLMNVESTGVMTVKTDAAMTIQSSAVMSIKCDAAMTIQASAALSVTASGMCSVTAGVLSVSAGMASFSGVLQCTTLIATTVVGTTYTPGVGNLL
jgi:uncharacterized protein involved in type VI secretion and phage assembly